MPTETRTVTQLTKKRKHETLNNNQFLFNFKMNNSPFFHLKLEILVGRITGDVKNIYSIARQTDIKKGIKH